MNTQNGYSKLSACALRQNIMLIYLQHSICTLCLIIDVILAKMRTMSDKIGKSIRLKNTQPEESHSMAIDKKLSCCVRAVIPAPLYYRNLQRINDSNYA